MAVKILRKDKADHPVEGPTHRRRFLNEARIHGRLQHPGIVPVHEVGRIPGQGPAVVMQWVDGATLKERLMPPNPEAAELRRRIDLFHKVCQAVAYAHRLAEPVVHRDLKPTNVMVTTDGDVYVMDWGLARITSDGAADLSTESAAERSTGWESADLAPDLTREGLAVGSPYYMPPEQAVGRPVTVRSDVFSLGAILAEILTGAPPYRESHAATVPPPAMPVPALVALNRAAHVDTWSCLVKLAECAARDRTLRPLADLARRCLSMKPEHRPADAGVVADSVRDWSDGLRDQARRAEIRLWRMRLVGLAAFALMSLGGVAWHTRAVARREAAERAATARVFLEGQVGKLEKATQEKAWSEVDRLLVHVEKRPYDVSVPDLDARIASCRRDREFVNSADLIRSNPACLDGEGRFDSAAAANLWGDRLRDYGIQLSDPEDSIRTIGQSRIKEEILSVLDHWNLSETSDAHKVNRVRLVRALSKAEWEKTLRGEAFPRDPRKLADFLNELDPVGLTPLQVETVARTARNVGGDVEEFLRRALVHHPSDFWLHMLLADAIDSPATASLPEDRRRARHEDAAAHMRAAVTIQPNNRLAQARLARFLIVCGRHDDAELALSKALDEPNFHYARLLRSELRLAQRRFNEARNECSEIERHFRGGLIDEIARDTGNRRPPSVWEERTARLRKRIKEAENDEVRRASTTRP